MAEEIGEPRLIDRCRVNIGEEYELSYWSRYFGVTPDQLKAVVLLVGEKVRDVEAEVMINKSVAEFMKRRTLAGGGKNKKAAVYQRVVEDIAPN